MRLALKGFNVIAAVEIYAQVQTLKREAAARGVALQVEKLDVTNEGDRKKGSSLRASFDDPYFGVPDIPEAKSVSFISGAANR